MNPKLVVLGLMSAVALGSCGAIIVETIVTGDNPTTYEAGETARVPVLDPGQCFDEGPTFDRNGDATVVDCDDPHDSYLIMNEHFTTRFTHDLAKAEREARAVCADDFEEYVATLPADSGVELRLYHGDKGRGMTEQRWTVACVAWSADGRFGSG